jgi:hypothetical protein
LVTDQLFCFLVKHIGICLAASLNILTIDQTKFYSYLSQCNLDFIGCKNFTQIFSFPNLMALLLLLMNNLLLMKQLLPFT